MSIYKGNNRIAGTPLPIQAGQSGKFLTTNGTNTSWATIQQAPSTDNETISLNTDQELQAIGVIDGQTGNADKFVSLTKAQYDALATKDADTFYNITDDSDVTLNLLQTIYPVGATYFTQNNTCPLSALFGTWQLQASTTLVTSVSANATTPVKGNGMTLGFTDGTSNYGFGTRGTNAQNSDMFRTGYYGASAGSTFGDEGSLPSSKVLGITTDSTKSGVVADTSNLLTSTTINMNIFVRIA